VNFTPFEVGFEVDNHAPGGLGVCPGGGACKESLPLGGVDILGGGVKVIPTWTSWKTGCTGGTGRLERFKEVVLAVVNDTDSIDREGVTKSRVLFPDRVEGGDFIGTRVRDWEVDNEFENRDRVLDSGLITGTTSSSLLSSYEAAISGKAGKSNSGDSPPSSVSSSSQGGSTLSSISNSTPCPSEFGIPSANNTESSGAISTDHFRGVFPLVLVMFAVFARGLGSGVVALSLPLREGD
jgi:hypothetical protein